MNSGIDQRPVCPNGETAGVGVIDLATGEVLDGIPVLVRAKRKFITEEYFIMFSASMEGIAHDRSLGAQDHRILHFILSRLESHNKLPIGQAEIGRVLGIDRRNVSTSFSKFIRKGVIVKSRRGEYILNPRFAWRGTAKQLPVAQRSAPPLRLNDANNGQPCADARSSLDKEE